MNSGNNFYEDDNTKLRKEFERLQFYSQRGANFHGSAQQEYVTLNDFATFALANLSILPPGSSTQLLGSVTGLNQYLEQQYPQMSAAMYSGGTIFQGTQTISAFRGVFTQSAQSYPRDEGPVHSVQVSFVQFFDRQDYIGRVEKLMGYLELDKTSQALYQFRAAWNAHFQQPHSASSAVLPIRDAIDIVIGQLINKRPIQIHAHKENVKAILDQLAATNVPVETNTAMQQEYQTLHATLSEIKDKKINRERERELMMDATIFLITFLSAIDPAKFRK